MTWEVIGLIIVTLTVCGVAVEATRGRTLTRVVLGAAGAIAVLWALFSILKGEIP